MMWVCPACWNTFSVHQTTCPACGADLTTLDQRRYTEKLVRALAHPEQETAIRVAEVLARRGDPEPVPILADAFHRRSGEPYVAAAMIRALGHFKTKDAHELLLEALAHESIIVRAAAAEGLLSLSQVAS